MSVKKEGLSLGFVYIWRDSKRKLWYLGSHLGAQTDGYTGSNNRFRCAIKSRPETFRRRILESHSHITSKELRYREGLWLSLMKDAELHGTKYYNEKNVASGGDIISTLTLAAKKRHARLSGLASKAMWQRMTPQEREVRRLQLMESNKTMDRSYLKARNKLMCSKTARIEHPDGGVVEIVRNISEFAQKHSLNYGNLKTMLRGGRQKSVGGFRGTYEVY